MQNGGKQERDYQFDLSSTPSQRCYDTSLGKSPFQNRNCLQVHRLQMRRARIRRIEEHRELQPEMFQKAVAMATFLH